MDDCGEDGYYMEKRVWRRGIVGNSECNMKQIIEKENILNCSEKVMR